MDTGAIVMLVIGLVGLFGTLAAGIGNYLYRARRDPDSTD